jgi:ornithine carbamoyltransferase
MGRGETVEDTAGVLSRYVDGIMIRTFDHGEVEAMGAASTVPVINGLTDLLHPCQLMADLQTAQEEFGPDLEGMPVAYLGDGNNMANSWLNAARVFGLDLRLACPEGFDPDPEILALAQDATKVTLTRDPVEAAEGARVLTTDTWASMGQEDEKEERIKTFQDYQVTQAIMEKGASDAIFLHCLPAYRGMEVAAEVIDGPQSRILDEAENRLHAQKAIMMELMV